MRRLPWKLFFYIITVCSMILAIRYEIMNMNKASQDVAVQTAVKPSRTRLLACLTFDDGPSELTPQILDILANHKIKAGFFLIGEEITKEREDIVKRLKQEGHMVGIHTYCHKQNVIYASQVSFEEDFLKVQRRIQEVLDQDDGIYRFPWGSMNRQLKCLYPELSKWVTNQGYSFYDWNVSAEDSVGTTSCYRILHNIQTSMKNKIGKENIVVLMHDSSTMKKTVEALPQIISMIEERGYTFARLDELEKPYHFPEEWRK